MHGFCLKNANDVVFARYKYNNDGDICADKQIQFNGFSKIARLSREIKITEKIDGTNGQIAITEDGNFFVGSRTRWITPKDDNHGFARWAYEHKDELMTLGVGSHFGEWWGQGIQRNYGLKEKKFSLFNIHRWVLHGQEPGVRATDPKTGEVKMQDVLPPCVGLVPLLYTGNFDTNRIDLTLLQLEQGGSIASPGFMKPEGIVIFHSASGTLFKKTIVGDEVPKGKLKE
jgi:hypothetical protein